MVEKAGQKVFQIFVSFWEESKVLPGSNLRLLVVVCQDQRD